MFKRVAPFTLLVLSGCLASKGDIELLQSEIRSSRDVAAQASGSQAARIDQLLAQIGRTNDSIRSVSQRLARFQGDVQTAHYEMGRQILQIQELTGQSQRRIQELRASLEERSQTTGSPAQPAVDSTRPPAGGPGPAQLFQNSVDQLRRGSSMVARNGFEDLLRLYPNTEDAPEAMIYIAKTYSDERNQGAADSVYALIIQRYPASPKAATALYKRADSMRKAGQSAAARLAFERIIRDYPRSDEAKLAQDQLRSLR